MDPNHFPCRRALSSHGKLPVVQRNPLSKSLFCLKMVNSKVVNPKLYGRPAKSHPTAHWGQLGASRKWRGEQGLSHVILHIIQEASKPTWSHLRESSAGKGDLGPDSLGGPWAGKDGCKWMCVCVFCFLVGSRRAFKPQLPKANGLVSHVWSMFTGPKRLTFSFWVLWANENCSLPNVLDFSHLSLDHVCGEQVWTRFGY